MLDLKSKAIDLDQDDPIAYKQNQYVFPVNDQGDRLLYLCGNSLGLQPAKATEYVNKELDRWGKYGVLGHFKGDPAWADYDQPMIQTLCKMVGANQDEVIISNTLSINIHLILVSFYRPVGKRIKILIEHNSFPSDLYALNSHLRFKGFNAEEILIELKPKPGESYITQAEIESAILEHKDTLALVYLGSVNYLNGQIYHIQSLSSLAHQCGALIGYDLAHGVGNLPFELHTWNVDFAVWCHYKYCNGGPNALAGMFIHQHHHHQVDQRLEGWWGNEKKTRFLMQPDFRPEPGASGWIISGPPILSLAGMKAGFEDFEEIGMEVLRKKSIALTDYLCQVLESLQDDRLNIITPEDTEMRGCQISIAIDSRFKKVYDHLLNYDVVVDWREPGIIRVAPVPMYNSFKDVFEFGEKMKLALKLV